MSQRHVHRLLAQGRCPLCGESVAARTAWWAIGAPESVRHGDFAIEAVGHRDCVEYATAVCPWLQVARFRRGSGRREDEVGVVSDPNKPLVWALVEAKGLEPYGSGETVYLAGAKLRQTFAYEDRELKRVTVERANEILRANGEEELT